MKMKETDYKSVEDQEINLQDLVKLIWRERWFILKFIIVFIIISTIYVMNLNNIYRASVSILPQNQETMSNKFSGLAALAGVNLNAQESNNEAFYGDVLRSNRILDKLIKKKWIVGSDKKEMYIYDFFEIERDNSHNNPEAKLYYDTKKYLVDEVILFTSSKENGLMTLYVSIPIDPGLSADVANWLANELHEFNENYRQKKSLENLLTVKRQLDEAKKELTRTENGLKEFQKSNKNYLQSTELQLDFARLQREVLTENAVYTELRKQYEIAKIDLEKSKKTITILDPARIPAVKYGPKRGLILVVLTIIGGVISILYTLLRVKMKAVS